LIENAGQHVVSDKQQVIDLKLSDSQIASVNTNDRLRTVLSFTEKWRKKYAFNRANGLKRLQDKVASGKVGKSISKIGGGQQISAS